VKTPTVIVLLVVVALSVFTLLNWSAIAASTSLSIGFTTVHAPLGLVLLIGSGLLTATFLVFVVFHQTAALVEARRFARDLRTERDLADKAEASRFTDLRAYLEGELRALADGSAAARADVQARLDRLEELLMTRLAEVGNGLAAHVAEVEDKLDRAVKPDAH
jgi:hypothetical protein